VPRLDAHSVERKLAATFAADVEGYSRLMVCFSIEPGPRPEKRQLTEIEYIICPDGGVPIGADRDPRISKF
jgi:hypothetical protein